MFRQGLIRFFLCCRQQCGRKVFLLFLIAFPCLMFLCAHLQKQDRDGIYIAVSVPELQTEDEGEKLEQSVMEVLQKNDTIFHFYAVESTEALQADVMTRKAECGYVLPEGLKEHLDVGTYSRVIEVYTAPSTVLDAAVNETVFAALMQCYVPEILHGFVQTDPMFEAEKQDEVWQDVEQRYEAARSDDSTFSFQYETLEGEPVGTTFVKSGFPVKTAAGIWVLLVLAGSLIRCLRERKKGYYYHGGLIPAILAPVVLSALSGIAAVILSV